MKKIDWKNLVSRAAWTFIEGFGVTFLAALEVGMDGAAVKAAALAAAMTGLSALKTFVLDLLKSTDPDQGGEVE